MYPDEPFQLDLSSPCLDGDGVNKLANAQNCRDYDLVSAVKRQSHFFYQVNNNNKKNKGKNMKSYSGSFLPQHFN